MALNILSLKGVNGVITSLKIRLSYALAFFIPLFVFSALTVVTLESVTPAYAGDIRYLYDEFGRITGEIDSNGQSTDYTYDARGNILSIKNSSATTVSITGFTPTSGTVGNTVTIYGTGFSNTASQNSVSFSGIAATVTSATATSLVTLVPTGASSGPITVTTPTGTATSTDHFIVNPLPVITGFTPNVGNAGTTVTITGNNFSNNKVAFNETPAVVTSASVTSVTTRVPSGAISGPISVTTPAGKAVSTADFFVPPGAYTGADVAFTGRINIDGSSQLVTINTANKIGLLIFNGTAGKRITLQMSEVTIASSVVSIFKPDGTVLASKTIDINGGYLEDNTLPVTGVYTIVVDPEGASTGSMKVSLLSVVDLAGQITINGFPVTVAIEVPGQNARLTFNGNAGQQINVQTVGPAIPSQISILNPDGTVLVSVSTAASGGSIYSEFKFLPVTGTYTVFLDPIGAVKGSISLMLAIKTSASSGPITLNTPVTVTVPGQSVKLTFSAVAGQQVSLALTGTLTAGTLRLLNTSGVQITSVPIAVGGTAFIPRQSLNVAGTYTASIDPVIGVTGTVTLIASTPISFVSSFIPPSATLTTLLPGESAAFTLKGSIGQNFSVALTASSFKAGKLTLAYPVNTGSISIAIITMVVVASAPIAADGTANLGGVTLPITTTYTIFVDPAAGVVGNATVLQGALNSSPITVNGPSVTTTTTFPGQSVVLTFNGSVGQNISVALAGSSFTSGTLRLAYPVTTGTGTTAFTTLNVVGSAPIAADGTAMIGRTVLNFATTYRVFVDTAVPVTGTATVAVSMPLAATMIALNTPATVTTAIPGQSAKLAFNAAAGQQVSLALTGNVTAGTLRLLYSTGQQIASAPIAADGATFIPRQSISLAGTYTVFVDPAVPVTATVTVIASTPVPASSTTPKGITTTGLLGQSVARTFSGSSGQIINVSVASSFKAGKLTLAYPVNTGSISIAIITMVVVASAPIAADGTANLAGVTLPITTTYTAFVDPAAGVTGSVQLSVSVPASCTICPK